MKNIFQFLMAVLVAGSLTSCFENPNLIYDGATVVEFDAAVTSAPAAGRTYPLLAVANGAGIQRARVNLVGPQQDRDQTINVAIETANSTAVSGTHFRLLSNTVTIPAKSSFGEVQIEILRVPPPATTGQTVSVVLMLEGGGELKPSENFKRLGWTIRL
jgi:hypothetical protein